MKLFSRNSFLLGRAYIYVCMYVCMYEIMANVCIGMGYDTMPVWWLAWRRSFRMRKSSEARAGRRLSSSPQTHSQDPSSFSPVNIVCVCMYVCTVCMYCMYCMYVCMSVCLYVCMYVCMYVCIHVHKYSCM